MQSFLPWGKTNGVSSYSGMGKLSFHVFINFNSISYRSTIISNIPVILWKRSHPSTSSTKLHRSDEEKGDQHSTGPPRGGDERRCYVGGTSAWHGTAHGRTMRNFNLGFFSIWTCSLRQNDANWQESFDFLLVGGWVPFSNLFFWLMVDFPRGLSRWSSVRCTKRGVASCCYHMQLAAKKQISKMVLHVSDTSGGFLK